MPPRPAHTAAQYVLLDSLGPEDRDIVGRMIEKATSAPLGPTIFHPESPLMFGLDQTAYSVAFDELLVLNYRLHMGESMDITETIGGRRKIMIDRENDPEEERIRQGIRDPLRNGFATKSSDWTVDKPVQYHLPLEPDVELPKVIKLHGSKQFLPNECVPGVPSHTDSNEAEDGHFPSEILIQIMEKSQGNDRDFRHMITWNLLHHNNRMIMEYKELGCSFSSKAAVWLCCQSIYKCTPGQVPIEVQGRSGEQQVCIIDPYPAAGDLSPNSPIKAPRKAPRHTVVDGKKALEHSPKTAAAVTKHQRRQHPVPFGTPTPWGLQESLGSRSTFNRYLPLQRVTKVLHRLFKN